MKTIPIKPKPAVASSSVRRLPAEWEPQAAVQLTWPRRRNPWGENLGPVHQVFLEIGSAVARFETLLLVVEDESLAEQIRAELRQRGALPERLATVVAPANDVWARDHGPITVLEDDAPLLLDFHFNGWGGKFAYAEDDQVTARAHAGGLFGRARRAEVPIVLEGGSIESDGAGTLMTTESCLLSPARNPKLSRPALEDRLKVELGATRLLWLKHGYLAGDDTDGHIDTLARFCDRDTIAYIHCPDPADEHYEELSAMAQELAQFRTAAGRPYRLVPLPWPQARLSPEGERLPATYANFLILNDAVLVPTYADPADGAALSQIQRCFPSRRVIGIPCLPLIQQHGSLHCVTMQLPQGTPL